MRSFKCYDDFQKIHSDAAFELSSYLLARPEFLNYKFSIAYELPNGFSVMYNSPHSPNGLILKIISTDNGYTVIQEYPRI